MVLFTDFLCCPCLREGGKGPSLVSPLQVSLPLGEIGRYKPGPTAQDEIGLGDHFIWQRHLVQQHQVGYARADIFRIKSEISCKFLARLR